LTIKIDLFARNNKEVFAMAANIITGYPQMPPLAPDELESFLKQPLIARLGTINEDGTIHLTPIFFRYENGEIILGTQQVSRRVRNIQRNPNVTLLIDDTTGPFRAALIYGKATLEYDNVIEKRTTIFEKYGPPEQAYKKAEGLCNKWPSVVIRVKPVQIISFDYSKASLL
jgi:nitroimidazol reductase NimA-like FMN-containing flavoprotein (pyridoxamine 5'-phosphate oxidase superfamily)